MNEDIAKSLALMQHLDEPYFFIEDKSKEEPITWYKGIFDEVVQEYIEDAKIESGPLSLETWLLGNDKIVDIYLKTNGFNDDYMVLTDEEADEQFTDYIRETIWACNSLFILQQCGLDTSDKSVKSFDKIKEDCEDSNDLLLSIVEETCGLNDFVEAIKNTDGRSLLSSYDGEEYEEVVDGVTYYIYRIN